MKGSKTWSLLTSLALSLLPEAATSEKICTSDDSFGWNITSQEDLDTLAQGCTTLDGRLTISLGYEGPFILRNVANITDDIAFDQHGLLFGPPPKVTVVEMPDLKSVQNVYLEGDNLQNISFPALRSARQMFLTQPFVGSSINLPALERVEYTLLLTGNYSSVVLTALNEVDALCLAASVGGCTKGGPAMGPPLDLEFPALETISRMGIYGRVKSFSVPKFTSFGDSGVALEMGLVDDTPASLWFPNLSHLSTACTVNISGPIASLYTPLLDNLGELFKMSTTHELDLAFPVTSFYIAEFSGALNSIDFQSNITDSYYLQITTSSPLALDLPVSSFYTIELNGKIESFKLPKVNSFDDLTIQSELPFDCGAFEKEMRGRVEIEKSFLHCNSTFHHHGLTPPQQAAVAVPVTVVGLGIVIGVIVCVRKRRAKRSKQLASTSNVQLTSVAREGEGEDLPPYSR